MAKKPNKIVNYFKEVKSELKKVVWPSFKQVKNNTLIVIICVLLVGAFIWVLDLGFARGWTLINPADETAQEEVVAGETQIPLEVQEETPQEDEADNTAQ